MYMFTPQATFTVLSFKTMEVPQCNDVAKKSHLTGNKILTHRQRHLNRIGFVSDRDCGQLKFITSVILVGLGDRILEHLLVSLLAQNGPDVHNLGLAAAPHAGAGEQRSEQKQTHRVEGQKSARRAPVSSPIIAAGGSCGGYSVEEIESNVQCGNF